MTAQIIIAESPDHALQEGLWRLKTSGSFQTSRNGPVLVAPGPVITEFRDPRARASLSPLRDANPFFHLYEAVWMLAGRNDVASVARYAAQMEAFSDDGEHLWGAYGFRWREFFGFDQLAQVVSMLRKDPTTRRAVLTMWAPNGDLVGRMTDDGMLEGVGRDIPCNTQVYFSRTSAGKLDMTVCNRSNDVIWGAYGANVVHMSFMHEVVAAGAGAELGTYYQMSNNYHIYTTRPDVQRLFETDAQGMRTYVHFSCDHAPLPNRSLTAFGPLDLASFLADCEAAAEFPTAEHMNRHIFFGTVFAPMMRAHAEYKAGDFAEAYAQMKTCDDPAWRTAGVAWLSRRELKAAKTQETRA
jgi:Thymidylate synthase